MITARELTQSKPTKMKTYKIINLGHIAGGNESTYVNNLPKHTFTEDEAIAHVSYLQSFNSDVEFCGFNEAFQAWTVHYIPSC